MRSGDPSDPLLLQVLPLGAEAETVAGFASDALDEQNAHAGTGLLQKYEGRALLIATGVARCIVVTASAETFHTARNHGGWPIGNRLWNGCDRRVPFVKSS